MLEQLNESPFGTIKRAMNQGYFLMQGLNQLGAEVLGRAFVRSFLIEPGTDQRGHDHLRKRYGRKR